MSQPPPLPSPSLSESLGIRGWEYLDPILLASLATETPVLLIGPHGTAKSMIVERLAQALDIEFRHYNASLINYDDLVGIPMPEEDMERLKFISTPGSVWQAEFIFFDEISRCRPDLQNKMFPIVHEKKVAGISLPNLRYRWAAMNPPAPDDAIGSSGSLQYLGSEPLDPALADRFHFIIPVPNWRQMSKDQRRRLVTWNDDVTGTMQKQRGLPIKIKRCRALIEALEIEHQEWLSDYIVCVVDLLEQAQLPQSPRRARMLARAVIAIQAARQVIEGPDVELEQSCAMALSFCLPQNATEVPPSRGTVMSAHKQAWEISRLREGDAWRQVLEENDPVRRIALADQLALPDYDLSRLITQALGEEQNHARRMGLATAIFLAFRDRRNLTPAAWEPLAQHTTRVFEPHNGTFSVKPGPMTTLWHAINEWINKTNPDTVLKRLERNYIQAGFPDMWLQNDWKDALERFRADLMLFGFEEELA